MLESVVSFLVANEPTISAVVGIMTLVAATWGVVRLWWARGRRSAANVSFERTGKARQRSALAALNIGVSEHSKLEELVAIRSVNVILLSIMAISFPWLVVTLVTPNSSILSVINLIAFAIALIAMGIQVSGANVLARWLAIGDALLYWSFTVLAVGPYHGAEYFFIALVSIPVLALSRANYYQRLFCICALIAAFISVVFLAHTRPPLLRVDEEILAIGYYFNAFFLSGAIAGSVAFYKSFASKRYRLIAEEKASSEALVSRMLPVERVPSASGTKVPNARWHEKSTVLYAVVTGFSELHVDLSPDELVDRLGKLYTRFDEIAHANGVEKIKTFGTTYVAAAGLKPSAPGDKSIACCAIAMRDEAMRFAQVHDLAIGFRCGVATGLAISGVIGGSRPRLDVWGAALDSAERLVSVSKDGEINVNDAAFGSLRETFALETQENLNDAHILQSLLV